MSRWKVILKKEYGNVILDYFNSKKEAEKEIEYRYNLCRHLGYSADLLYEVVKEPSSRKN